MEVSSTQTRAIGRGRGRPAQALYMPPARRHREPTVHNCDKMKTDNKPIPESTDIKIMDDSAIDISENDEIPLQNFVDLNIKDITNKCIKSPRSESQSNINNKIPVNIIDSVQENVKTLDSDVKKRKDEAKTPKTRNSKVMDVKCDVLQISSAKNIKKSPIKLVQVDQWEDLVNSDEEPSSPDGTVQKNKAVITKYDDDDHEEYENLNNDQLEHIVEIYDFPSTFKTPDIMQIYNEMDQESMYIKWLTETRALLVLGSAMQAKRALGIENPFIKSRPAALGSHMALEAVRTSKLRPAMKRPQTSMQAARRMITTALGAKSTVSREVQQRERDALRKAKEEKRNQRQSERDAWEGNPRPTSA
ncbi:coiled-coil domain-containing protein R3HCC1L isoform X2 [Atheta coriaria]